MKRHSSREFSRIYQSKLSRFLGIALLCALIGAAASAHAQAAPQTPAILLGTAWYPEQWPESRWDADLALMQQAGIHMVRVGEFAWSRMEPSEGHYGSHANGTR